MKFYYLTVDGMFSGSGIRDSVEGGYFYLRDLKLSDSFIYRIKKWLENYAEMHFPGYGDRAGIAILDICLALQQEIPFSKIEYYSVGEGRKLLLSQ